MLSLYYSQVKREKMWITFLNYPKKTYKNIYFLPISIMIVPKMRKIVIQSVDNFYGIYLFSYFCVGR